MAAHWTKSMTRRTLLLGSAQLAIVGAITWRMYQLSVVQSEEFRLLAEENRVNVRLQAPDRGLIFDRSAMQLTYNEPVYAVDIIRAQSLTPKATLNALAKLIPLNEERIDSILREMRRKRDFVPVRVASDLNWQQIAKISLNTPALAGIVPSQALLRFYPYGAIYANVIGYTGRVSPKDLERDGNNDPVLLLPKFPIGKNGVEYRLDHDLRGKAGFKRIEVNALGREMRVLSQTPSTKGRTVQLTTATELQRIALERLGDESGAVVVMDIKNGDVLACASAPSYDPNLFVDGISVKDYNHLRKNTHRPLADKSVQGIYPPGSTFKMIVGLTALRLGLLKADEKINCLGHFDLNKQRFHCWRSGGHGRMALIDAIRESCDVYFYDLALRVGIAEIAKTAKTFGLGSAFDLPLRAINSGLVPSKQWKQRVKNEPWYQGDTVNVGIGQGFLLASPMQLAVMTARLASGKAVKPRLIGALDGKKQPVGTFEALDYTATQLNLIRKGMFEVINHPKGTANIAKLPDDAPLMAGKTGTAQVRFITKAEREAGIIKNEDLPWERRDHALFVAYAPFDDPQIAIAVVVEHGGSGSGTAAPIARDVMTAAFEQKSRNYRPTGGHSGNNKVSRT